MEKQEFLKPQEFPSQNGHQIPYLLELTKITGNFQTFLVNSDLAAMAHQPDPETLNFLERCSNGGKAGPRADFFITGLKPSMGTKEISHGA